MSTSASSTRHPERSPLQYLRGVGPRRAAALESLGLRTVRDVLYYFPRGYLDRSTIVPIAQLRNHLAAGDPVTVIGEVHRSEVRKSRRSRRLIFFLTVRDASGFLTCVWFEGVQWYTKAFENGELLALSAVPTPDKLSRVQFVHPEFDRLRGAQEEDEPDWGKMINTGGIVPKYPSTAELAKVGLDSRGFRRLLRTALRTHLEEIPDVLPPPVRERCALTGLKTALQHVHYPPALPELEAARRRLKFDELFQLQLLLALRRRRNRDEVKGFRYNGDDRLVRSLMTSLPFALTAAQERVLKEILADMTSDRPMSRLLQGDVGSGKTVVALIAMLTAVGSGSQAAFMAPTEILAEQHYRTLTRLLKHLPVTVRLLIGGQRKRVREDILEDVRSGRGQIIVGTHALLEGNVEFARLALAVIDEQHRFGVVQRSLLREKGLHPDVLVMTATPIPRTLSMTLYGDLDVSVLDEMPLHRKPIRTAVRLEDQKGKVYEFVRSEVRQGRQAYIVVPLIEESEKLDLKAATKEFERLSSEVFPDLRLGLLHGRMKTEEKDRIMQEFGAGKIDVLVATTVIEVGIDVPNASVMVIEDAERFGLSQLHQLRGRVGRGADQSYCVLIADYSWFERRRGVEGSDVQQEQRAARVRLETMAETADGFRIAEVDLELRGPGELFGTRQSGLPELRIASLVEDAPLLKTARREAFDLVDRDPQLRLPEHEGLRQHIGEHRRRELDLGTVG